MANFSRPMCRMPRCPDNATTTVTADGTSASYQVCSSDVGWAKRELEQDFPAHTISSEPINRTWEDDGVDIWTGDFSCNDVLHASNDYTDEA